MKIDDDHQYHGAALIQIAESPQFTAINQFKFGAETSRNAYQINNNIGVYLKYASKPAPPHSEYTFTFHSEHLAELSRIAGKVENVFIAMVCVKVRQICCLSYESLTSLIQRREVAKGEPEKHYVILVTARRNESFHVYVNKPHVKNTMAGKPLIISLKDFPEVIFR